MTRRRFEARRGRSSAVVAALASLAVLTAACTGTSGADGTTSPATEAAPSSPGVGPGSSTASTPAPSGPDASTADPSAPSEQSQSEQSPSEQSSSEQAPPPATTPVPPPSAGDINQTVAAVEPTTLAPASFQQAVTVDPQVTATVDGVQRVDATGRGVGEISGPALAYTVSITNTGSGALDLGAVSVNVQDESGAPFSSIDGDPAKPLSGSLEPGQSAQGVYVFTLPADFSGPTTLSLAYAAGAPIALFTGVAS